MKRTLLVLTLLPLGAALHAQGNLDPNIDVHLADLADLSVLGRIGTFPDGTNGCALETTVCNVGTAPVLWQQAMDPDHPFIAFLVARETGGRFQQISDRSFVKHGSFALSGSSCGASCLGTDGTTLGIGCSDTSGAATNGDRFWLGPPDEIDPWTGIWRPICSHFDRGEPPAPAPGDCDGLRSLSPAQVLQLGDVSHRVLVRDAELATPGAFWFQAQVVVSTESSTKRGDSLGSRAFTPVWNGAQWDLVESGAILHDSVLQRWTGATVASRTNGFNDGRLYVATKVTGPVEGFYHYEVAVHNRDNARGVSRVHIPMCPGARVRALGSSDVDSDASNDWSASVILNEVVFEGLSNPLRWNSIYNFWFDSDAAPETGSYGLDQAVLGSGLFAVPVSNSAPLGLYNVFAGPGCARDTPPTLFAAGSPPRALLGNSTFALHSTGNAPLQPSFLHFANQPGPFLLRGCSVWLGTRNRQVSVTQSDALGLAVHPTPIPNSLALEGYDAYLQLVGRDPGNGILFRDFELSDGLLVRTGNAISGCR